MPLYQSKSTKEKILGYFFLTLLTLSCIYAFYETFFLENPNTFSVFTTAFILFIIGGIFVLLILEKISQICSTNKTLQKIAKTFEEVWLKILDAFPSF